MIEGQPINIIDINPKACSKAGHDQAHPNGAGEPISSVDFRLYRVVLEEDGRLPREDARKQAKTLKEMYASGDEHERNRIANVIYSTFEGLTSKRVLQPINTPTPETVVFSRK